MTETQRTAIERHGANLLEIFPDAVERDPIKLCKRLRRLEAEAGRIGLRLCNGPEYETEYDADLECAGVLGKVNELLGNASVPIFVNRDPRGYALKIDDEWVRANNVRIDRDWGGYGLIAPEIK